MSTEKSQSAIQLDRIQINEKTKILVDTIRNTSNYQGYHKSLAKLQSDKALYQKYKEFQQKNIMLEINKDETYNTDIKALYAEYNDLLMDRVVSEFLTKQQQMCRMVNDIFDAIAQAVDMDVSYFDL